MTNTIDQELPGTTLEHAALEPWIDLLRAEYKELPGMHLTRPQVRRLFDLDQTTCDALLHELEQVHFLRCTESQAFVRADCG